MSNIYNVIKFQILKITQKENYIYKTIEIDKAKIKTKENLNLDLPFHEKTLLLTYFYLNQFTTNEINKKLEEIENNIEKNLNLIKNGSCKLFEYIFFNFKKCYELSNMYSKFYFEILERNEKGYNYKLHKQLLKILKEMI